MRASSKRSHRCGSTWRRSPDLAQSPHAPGAPGSASRTARQRCRRSIPGRGRRARRRRGDRHTASSDRDSGGAPELRQQPLTGAVRRWLAPVRSGGHDDLPRRSRSQSWRCRTQVAVRCRSGHRRWRTRVDDHLPAELVVLVDQSHGLVEQGVRSTPVGVVPRVLDIALFEQHGKPNSEGIGARPGGQTSQIPQSAG